MTTVSGVIQSMKSLVNYNQYQSIPMDTDNRWPRFLWLSIGIDFQITIDR